MLKNPATIPISSQNGKPMISSPMLAMTPTMVATTSWPRKKPPTAAFMRRARTRISGRAASGISPSATRLRWGRSTSR